MSDILAHLAQGAAASGACLTGRQDLIVPIQMIWQRLAAVLAFVVWGLIVTGGLPGVLVFCGLRDLIVL